LLTRDNQEKKRKDFTTKAALSNLYTFSMSELSLGHCSFSLSPSTRVWRSVRRHCHCH